MAGCAGGAGGDASADGAEGRARAARAFARRVATLGLALAGAALLAWVVASAGVGAIARELAGLGVAAPLVFVPYGVGALLDARGLGVALPCGVRVPLRSLALVRLAGEAVSFVTPTGYLGGEPFKVLLLRGAGVGSADGVAAVAVAKTALVAAQILFVVLGLALFFARRADPARALAAGALSAALGVAAVALLVRVQRRGLAERGARVLGRFFPSSTLVARLGAQAGAIDARLARLYGPDRRVFAASFCLHFAGWLVGVAEVALVLALVGAPVGLADAFLIESLTGTLRVFAFVVPGTLGVQEYGGVALCALVGVGQVPAVALMLAKRARELGYLAIGLVALVRGRAHLRP